MGIPKFYRWISERYPLINQKIDGQVSPEFDCLYLDMNGIFHTCSHGPNARSGMPVSEMYSEIFKYIAHIVSLVQPKKLLYMAVDGVAPRAKQNHQRQRRFVAAKDAKVAMDSLRKTGRPISTTSFDSNVITPGTDWMEDLSRELDLFVRKQVCENKLWKQLTVIYSDHLAPGEGEHKIMEYIRNMKMQPGYCPNTSHCLYGLDADLIILSLLSHEPHFALLREEVIFGLERQERHIKENRKILRRKNVFQLFHLSVLRKYLLLEFEVLKGQLSFEFDLERIIDDFVFLCMFVGCDFLPHMPTIDIATGGMQTLFDAYRKVLPTLDDYLLSHGTGKEDHAKGMNYKNVRLLFKELAAVEAHALKEQYLLLTKHYNRVYKDRDKKGDGAGTGSKHLKEPTLEEIEDMLDLVATGGQGFKNRYYNDRWTRGGMQSKEQRKRLCFEYLEGIQWILNYYYGGCCSWGWYYKHHYAPLVSDMAEMDDDYKIEFELGEPYMPFEQLLAVLPIASGNCLPLPYRNLMLKTSSPLQKYYPTEFEIDMNFSTVPWGGVALLPWINEKLLKTAVASVNDSGLTDHERMRNSRRVPREYTYSEEVFKKKNRIQGPQSSGKMIDGALVRTFDLPAITSNNGHFMTRPCAQCVAALPGHPQFDVMQVSTFLTKIPCKIFGLPSKYDTLVVKLFDAYEHHSKDADEILEQMDDPQRQFSPRGDRSERKQKSHPRKSADIVREAEMSSDERNKLNSDAKQIMREKQVFTDWPYLREARVVQVETEAFTYVYKVVKGSQAGDEHASQSQIAQYDNDASLSRQWMAKCVKVKESLYTLFGVDCGPVTCLVTVRKLRGMRRNGDTFETRKVWSDEEIVVPKSLICWSQQDVRLSNFDHFVADRRFMLSKIDFKREFGLGTPVMYVGHSDEYFGKFGRVLERHESGFLDIRVISQFDNTNFARDAIDACKNISYSPLYYAAKSANMDKRVLSRVCGQVIVKLPYFLGLGQSLDLGLNLKLAKQGLVVPGYSRGIEKFSEDTQNSFNEIQLSGRTVELVRQYRKRFPSVFAVIASNTYNKTLGLNNFLESNRIEVPFEEFLSVIDNDQFAALQIEKFEAMERKKDSLAKQKKANAAEEDANKGVDDILGDLQADFEKMGLGGLSTLHRDRTDVTDVTDAAEGTDVINAEINDVAAKSLKVSKNDDDVASVPTEADDDIDDDATVMTANIDELSLAAAPSDTAATAPESVLSEENIQISNSPAVMEANDASGKKIGFNGTNGANGANGANGMDAVDQVFAATRQVTLEEVEFKRSLEVEERDEAVEFLQSVVAWIKDLKVSKLPLLPQQSRSLPHDAIEAVEKAADKYYKKCRKIAPKGIKLMKVPVHHVYAADPDIPWSPSPAHCYKLGDRVASLRTDRGLPFGTLGTVVGVHKDFLEMVTDRPVLGGTTLHSRCSDFRGAMMPYDGVINLSRPPHKISAVREDARDTRDTGRYGGNGGYYGGGGNGRSGRNHHDGAREYGSYGKYGNGRDANRSGSSIKSGSTGYGGQYGVVDAYLYGTKRGNQGSMGSLGSTDGYDEYEDNTYNRDRGYVGANAAQGGKYNRQQGQRGQTKHFRGRGSRGGRYRGNKR